MPPGRRKASEASGVVVPIKQQTQESTKVFCSAKSVIRDVEGEPILDDCGRKQYRPCKRPPMRGTHVCASHGGLAKQVRQKAERQLLAARDQLMEILIGIAKDGLHPDQFRALTWALERSGFKPGMAIEVTQKPWQKALADFLGDDGTLELGTTDTDEEDDYDDAG